MKTSKFLFIHSKRQIHTFIYILISISEKPLTFMKHNHFLQRFMKNNNLHIFYVWIRKKKPYKVIIAFINRKRNIQIFQIYWYYSKLVVKYNYCVFKKEK